MNKIKQNIVVGTAVLTLIVNCIGVFKEELKNLYASFNIDTEGLTAAIYSAVHKTEVLFELANNTLAFCCGFSTYTYFVSLVIWSYVVMYNYPLESINFWYFMLPKNCRDEVLGDLEELYNDMLNQKMNRFAIIFILGVHLTSGLVAVAWAKVLAVLGFKKEQG